MKRVTLYVDDELEQLGYDQVRSRIRIRLKDDRLSRGRYDVARGHPEKPLSWEELGDKFRDCADLVLSRQNAEEAIQLVARIEQKPKSLGPLFQSAGRRPRQEQPVKPAAQNLGEKVEPYSQSHRALRQRFEARRTCRRPSSRKRNWFSSTPSASLASSTMDFGPMVTRVAQKLGGAPGSLLIGTSSRVAAANAVIANSTLAHGLDCDDTLEEAIVHTGCLRRDDRARGG